MMGNWKVEVWGRFRRYAPGEWLALEGRSFRTSTEARIAGNNLMRESYYWAWSVVKA